LLDLVHRAVQASARSGRRDNVEPEACSRVLNACGARAKPRGGNHYDTRTLVVHEGAAAHRTILIARRLHAIAGSDGVNLDPKVGPLNEPVAPFAVSGRLRASTRGDHCSGEGDMDQSKPYQMASADGGVVGPSGMRTPPPAVSAAGSVRGNNCCVASVHGPLSAQRTIVKLQRPSRTFHRSRGAGKWRAKLATPRPSGRSNQARPAFVGFNVLLAGPSRTQSHTIATLHIGTVPT